MQHRTVIWIGSSAQPVFDEQVENHLTEIRGGSHSRVFNAESADHPGD